MPKDINHCSWCGAPTVMEKMQLPDTPILEFLEEKINKLGRNRVWGENSNWAMLNLDPDDEAELLVYDDMLNNITPKYVCEKCLQDDNELYKKYYEDDDDYMIRIQFEN
jgi:hypothetical protein